MTRRMIESKTWQSFQVGQLNYRQRCLWIGLITIADDQGRGRAHPGIVRGALFPYDDIGLDEIQSDLEHLAELELIYLYKNDDGAPLYQIVSWWRYQRPTWSWPSDLPAPDGWSDREKYRQGNDVVENGWDGDGGFTMTSDDPTVTSPRAHDDLTVSKAPSTSGSTSGSTKEMGADAPPESEPERKRSAKDKIRADLEQHFSERTGLPKPKTNTAAQRRSAGTLWWKPLREIAELCEWDGDLAKRLIDATLVHLSGQVTIASPKSIIKTAIAVYTGNAPGAPKFARAEPEREMELIEDPDNPGKYVAREVAA